MKVHVRKAAALEAAIEAKSKSLKAAGEEPHQLPLKSQLLPTSS